MARRGGTQQLQVELNSDEDLENFLLKSGLVLLDIYSEWCGQCLGMVSALKKIKLEIAGDNLVLGVAKAENISHFSRFVRKSEPTWLFIVNGQAVNIAFGSDQPALIKIVLDELNLLNSTKPRKTYQLSELQPIEIERNREADEARAAAEAKQAQEIAQKRLDYLNFVTDTIMENLPDMAVTIFGTHVGRELVKKILEPADDLYIQCKDRKYTAITKEEFETINYDCKNPLPLDVQELMNDEEVLVCYWKLPDGNFKLLREYAKLLTTPKTAKDESGETYKLKSILKSANIKVEFVLEAGEAYEEPPEPEPDVDDIEPPPPVAEAQPQDAQAEVESLDGEEGEEEEGGEMDLPPPPPPPPPLDMGFDFGLDALEEVKEEAEEEDLIRYGYRYVKMPAIWIPGNQRTHAALIYTLFHSQTSSFLPPDPLPDPPHIIMAFEPWRSSQLIDMANRNSDKIPVYGYFTSDDTVDAEFIARTPEKYELSTKSPDDKLVMRVNKVTSHMMLSLATYNPTYVSPSVDIGAEEAKVFFPEDMKTASKEQLEIAEEQKRLRKQKKVKKIGVADDEGEDDDDGEDEGEGEGDEFTEYADGIEEEGVDIVDNYGEYPPGEQVHVAEGETAETHPAEHADEMGDEGAAGDGEYDADKDEEGERMDDHDGERDEGERDDDRPGGDEARSDHKLDARASEHEGLRTDDSKMGETKPEESKPDEPKKEEPKPEEPKKEEKPEEPKPEPEPKDDD